MRVRRPHSRRGAATLALVCSLGLAVSPANAATWTRASSPNPSVNFNELLAITSVSPTEAWAVGHYENNSASLEEPLALHWNGATWTQFSTPSLGLPAFLFSVDAESAGNVFAVGQVFDPGISDYQPLVEHWNGTSWSVSTLPSLPSGEGGGLFGVTSVPGTTDFYAVGYHAMPQSAHHTLIEHWNGSSWSTDPSPDPGTFTRDLYGASATSASDVWAVGYDRGVLPPKATMTLHWNGTSWKKVGSPNVGTSDNMLNGVSAFSTTDAWAVGRDAKKTLTMHWNGTKWSSVTSPSPGTKFNELLGVDEITATRTWAVGRQRSGTHDQTLILQWNGTSWRVVTSPNPAKRGDVLDGVDGSSTTDVWSVGVASKSAIDETLILHCC